MPLFSLSIALLIGLCLYAGVHFAFHFKHSYETRTSNISYLLFSLMSFSAIGFMLAELVAYHSHNPGAYITAFRWRIYFALIFFVFWPWFIYHYTGAGPRWLIKVLSVYLLAQMLPNAIREYGSFFDEPTALLSRTLPWGETITMYVKQTTIWFALAWIGIIANILFTYVACFRQYARGQHRQALILGAGISIFTLLLIENFLVATGKLDFIFLAQFGFPALIIIMGASLHMTTRQSIEQSETKFRTLFEAAGDAILLLKDGVLIDCNPQALTVFGCTRETFLGKTPMDFSPPTQYDGSDSIANALKLINAAMTRGQSQSFAWRHIKLDGTPFDAEVTLNRIDLNGEPCLQGIVRDVTIRKRTEEAIKNIATGVSSTTGEDFFQNLVIYLSKLFDTKYAFIGLIDSKDTLTINILAICEENRITDNFQYALKDTPCAVVLESGTHAQASGVQQAFPNDSLLEQMHAESYIGTPLFDASGVPLGLMVLLDDKPLAHTEWIGEILQIFAARAGAELVRVRIEHDLYIKERAMEAAAEGMMLTDISTDNRIVYANQAMETITGYSREELVGAKPNIFQGPNTDPAARKQIRELIQQQQPCHIEILNYRKDGTPFWNELTITPVKDESDKVTHFIGTQLDITQRRQTEEALRQSQKMEAVGQLAGGIAHDFNNQLGIVIGYLDFLHAHLEGETKPSQWVATATTATLRCIDLTRQLLTFSRNKPKETTVTDLNQQLAKMDTLITRAITPAISVQTFTGEDLWPVAIDPGEFQDAMLNLVINARDAMPQGGQLIIETTNKLVDSQYVSLNPDLRPGEFVQVMVSDTGVGMDKDTTERVFEPFFTTKSEGKGTGLGLAMVYSFAKRYDGVIKVYSESGIGTTFRLYLPRVPGETQVAADSAATTSPPTGTETVLVVDDEADLLLLAERYLQKLGYRTLAADNPQDALNLLKQHTDIDLLFSDVVMPGNMNGYALAEQAVASFPGLKVLLTSGFTANTIAVNDQARFTANILHKPYRQYELAKRVRDVLDMREQR